MISSIGLGLWSVNFSNYKEVMRKLRELGIEPTGDAQIDKAKLRQAIEKKVEKFEIKQKEEDLKGKEIAEEMEEKKIGATILGEQNRIYFGI